MKNYFISSCHQLSFNIIMELHIQPIKWSKISYICNMSLNSDQTMFNMNKTFVGLYIGCRLKNYDMRFQIKQTMLHTSCIFEMISKLQKCYRSHTSGPFNKFEMVLISIILYTVEYYFWFQTNIAIHIDLGN